MTIDKDKITEIFFMADNFCQLYDRFIKINGLARKRDKSKRKYHRDSSLSDAEVITIMILFHLCGYKCLKHFYINMKGQIMTISDRILLRERALIETINDELKNMAQIEHSRHRSVTGFTVNLMAGLAAYSFFPKEPMIDLERDSPCENGLIQPSLFLVTIHRTHVK